MSKFIFFVIAFIFCSYDGFSQFPEIKVSADSNNVLIGDQIKIKLEVKNKNKFNVIWSPIVDTLGSLEVVKKSKIDTTKKNNQYVLSQNLLVTSFDGGTHPLPSFTFTFINSDNSQDTFFTEPIYLKFNSVDVDTTQDIKDIKGPLEVSIDWEGYLIYLIILIAVLVIAYFGYGYWKKRKQVLPDLGYDPSIPPYVLALEALKQLDSEKLWQGGYVKKYFIRLTDIIRIYIERQFKIKAMEMVTPEIISSMRAFGFENSLINDMSELFSLADFVKFAKHQPLPDENTKCMNYSVNFVNISAQMKTEVMDNAEVLTDNGQQITDNELTTPNSQLTTDEGEEKK